MVEGKKSVFTKASSIEALEARIAPATFSVTTSADSGPGSFRQAILDANATPEADVISGDVVYVLSALPTITAPVKITGIKVDGTNAGAGVSGMIVGASITFESGGVSNFDGNGIIVNPGGSLTGIGITVERNALDGVLVNGASADISIDSVITDNGRNGVSFKNAIRGHVSLCNISGNAGHGISIEGSGNVGIGNEQAPGVGGNGDTVIKTKIWNNGLAGIYVRDSSEIAIGGANVTGNGGSALLPEDRAGIVVIDSEQVSIGVPNANRLVHPAGYAFYTRGNNVSANFGDGVSIQGGAHVHVAANIISGNTGDGVRIDGAEDVLFSYLEYNDFGISKFGHYHDFANTLAGNTITGNGGVGIRTLGMAANINIRGQEVRANEGGAIIVDDASNVTIGGTVVYTSEISNIFTVTSMDGNVIDCGPKSGVVVFNGSRVTLVGNKFIGTGLPIDLGGDGATLNDSGDVDAGVNHLQNYPLLEFSGSGDLGGTKAILDTDAPATPFRLQIYGYDSVTSTYRVVATQDVTTDGRGAATFNFVRVSGPALFATATNLTTGETSEMSPIATLVPLLNIGSISLTEGDIGTKSATVTVSLSLPSDKEVSVNYSTANGTAVAGSDYSSVSGALIFAPGELSKTFTVPIIGDTTQEISESFYVDLSASQGTPIGQSRGEVRIINDDAVPKFRIEDQIVIEGSNPANGWTEYYFTVKLKEPSLGPVTVRLRSSGGTAAGDTDYYAVDSLVTFAPGETSKSQRVYVKNDTEAEFDETINFVLSEASDGIIEAGTATLTIADDDGWSVVIDPVDVIEGSSKGLKTVPVTARLVHSLGMTSHLGPIIVGYTTQDGSAISGSDFQSATSEFLFAPGEMEGTIAVHVVEDKIHESNETFGIRFYSSFGANVPTTLGIVTITDDDPERTINIADFSVGEGSSFQYQISLSSPSLVPVTVHVRSSGGTAAGGTDYYPVDELVTFAPGETLVTKLISIKDDTVIESSESILLSLSDPDGAAIENQAAVVTIIDNDHQVLKISKDARHATWIDADGDLVKLHVSKPVLSAGRFYFGWDEEGRSVLESLSLDVGGPYARPSPISVDLKVAKGGPGDGKVALAGLSAKDLGIVRIDGNLGQVFAGDGNLHSPGIGRLVVDSLGSNPGGADHEASVSSVLGGIGSIVVKGDIIGEQMYVHGGRLGTLHVGGNVIDSLVAVVGDEGSTFRVGKVTVRGDWSGSSLAVGVNAGLDGMFGTPDDQRSGGLLSRIAGITIGGTISGTTEAENAMDHFGFVAGKIAAFQVGQSRLPLSDQTTDVIELGETSDVTLREVSPASS